MFKLASVALGCAAIGVVVSAAAAQDAAITQGGDVSASEVTPLPPIVVSSPTEPIVKSRGTAAKATQPGVPAAPIPTIEAAAGTPGAPGAPGTASGTAVGAQGGAGIFTLGERDMIGGATITSEAMWTFNKTTLDQAAAIVPGVTMNNTGGARNERDIFVRGFDRFRVPLSIDGVRIYLPADNRLDFNRFLTPDLSEIQFQKGYVSVINGPGGMGGAINMVSRRPTKPLEFEARGGALFDGDLGSVGQWSSYAFAGSRLQNYYAQISGNMVDQDHWDMSDNFNPVLRINEDGGNRDHSNIKDWRINAKVGFTPNASDEYTINYTTQHGEKSAPLHVRGQVIQGPRYWDWPVWDVTSLSWLSKTQLGDKSYVKTNAYYNTFYNIVDFYDNITYTTITGTNASSIYGDSAYGGFVELGTDLIPMNTLKTAVHFRHDDHGEQNVLFPFTRPKAEPIQRNIEETWSLAAEDTLHVTRRLDVIGGFGFDFNNVLTAQDFANGVLSYNKTPSAQGYNYQGGVIYGLTDTAKVHATVSSRIRFPTVFERYSTRFGTQIPNPDLAPERATNYEIGWQDTIFKSANLSAAIFYSDLKNAIQPLVLTTGRMQNANLPKGTFYGFELSADWDVLKDVRVGGNYTYLERSYEYGVPGPKPEGTPRHEAFLYLSWQALPKWSITPNLELASDRNSLITSCATTLRAANGTAPAACRLPRGRPGSSLPNYAYAGAYALLNLKTEYKFSESITAAIGGTNLLDQDYELAEGFPEPGRMFFANIRARF